MMVEMTKQELEFIKETLETAIAEFDGISEWSEHDEYIITTGADEMCVEALGIINSALVDDEDPEEGLEEGE